MLKNIFKVLTGNMFSSLATYFSLLYLSIYLTSIEYGGFTKFYYTIGVLFIIFDLGLSSSLVLSCSKLNKIFHIKDVIIENKIKYTFIIFITFSIGLLTFSIQTLIIIIAIAIFSILNKFISVKYQILQCWSESVKVIFYMTFFRSIALVIYVYVIMHSIHAHIQLYQLEIVVLCTSILAFFFSYFSSKKAHKEIQRVDIKDINIKTSSVYIYIGSVLAVVCMRSDVFLIDHFISSQSSGEYAKVSILFFAFPMLISSINSVLLRYYSKDGSHCSPLHNKLKHLIILFLVIYFLISFFVINFHGVIEKNFNVNLYAIKIFMILLFAYMGAVISGTYESQIMAQNQRYYMFIKIIQLIALYLTFFISYKNYGVVSGSISFLMSRFFGWFLVINYYVSKNEDFNYWIFWKK